MLAWRQKVPALLVVLFVGALWCAPAAGQQTHKTHKTPVKKEAAPQTVQPQAAPAPPPTPEQMPATPAQVTYQNSQLTILARNSTVGDILRAVRKQTGASIDAPPDAKQRVVGQFGPGPARDVLASVLDASGFNYVLLGSAANPNGLQNIIVTVKSNEPAGTAPPPTPDASNQADDANQSNQADEPEPEPEQPSESFVPQDNDANSSDASSQDNQSPPAKTPEQLLQELQRQQQLQQLQQQQQNQGAPQNSTAPQDQMHQTQR